MRTSLIFTVKNESETLPRLLDSIAAQTRRPDEIVVVDGGSADGTLDVLHAHAQRLPLKILSCPGANISQGRNAAIRAASGDVICATDAGVRLDAVWLEELMRAFADRTADSTLKSRPTTHVDVVAGFFVPDPKGVFETALAATTLPALRDIQPDRFLPSSRSVAFSKSAWESAGGYPEWLDYCEDLIFDRALRGRGCSFAFAPSAVAYFRPRPTLGAFFKQYYRYARGDGKANLWLRRHVIRYLTYLVAPPLLIALTLAAPFVALWFWLVAGGLMLFTPYRRLIPMIRGLSFADQLCASAWVPIVRVTGDLAKMVGYPVGVAWRLRFGKRRSMEVEAVDKRP